MFRYFHVIFFVFAALAVQMDQNDMKLKNAETLKQKQELFNKFPGSIHILLTNLLRRSDDRRHLSVETAVAKFEETFTQQAELLKDIRELYQLLGRTSQTHQRRLTQITKQLQKESNDFILGINDHASKKNVDLSAVAPQLNKLSQMTHELTGPRVWLTFEDQDFGLGSKSQVLNQEDVQAKSEVVQSNQTTQMQKAEELRQSVRREEVKESSESQEELNDSMTGSQWALEYKRLEICNAIEQAKETKNGLFHWQKPRKWTRMHQKLSEKKVLKQSAEHYESVVSALFGNGKLTYAKLYQKLCNVQVAKSEVMQSNQATQMQKAEE